MQATTLLIIVSSLACAGAVGLGYELVFRMLDGLNRSYLDDLRDRMERVGMDASWLPAALRGWWGGVLGTFLLVGVVLGMWPVAVMAAALVYRLVPMWLEGRLEKWRTKLRDQLEPAVRSVTSAVRAGLTLERALKDLSQQAEDPLGAVLRGVVNQIEQGRDFRDVMTELKDRMGMDSFTLFVTVLLISHAKGGNPAPVLERIGKTLEEQQRLERKREADTAAGRMLVFVLGLFPVAFLGMTYLLDPESVSLVFSMILGQVVLCGVGLLIYASVRWAGAILKRVE
jgi:tight adherence protein B